ADDGHLDAMQLTGGSSLLNGMYYFRGDVPLREFAAAQSKLVGLGVQLYGRRIFPKLPFEEAFFLPFARQFREELDLPLILLGGINERATIDGALGEGFRSEERRVGRASGMEGGRDARRTGGAE